MLAVICLLVLIYVVEGDKNGPLSFGCVCHSCGSVDCWVQRNSQHGLQSIGGGNSNLNPLPYTCLYLITGN